MLIYLVNYLTNHTEQYACLHFFIVPSYKNVQETSKNEGPPLTTTATGAKAKIETKM